MGKRVYSDDVKAAVMTELLAGQAVAHVAKKYDIPNGTVKGWKSRAVNGSESLPVPPQKKAALGEIILGLLEQEIITCQEIARQVANPDWLQLQSASEIAVLYGVMQDKAFRKIEALDRNARSDN